MKNNREEVLKTDKRLNIAISISLISIIIFSAVSLDRLNKSGYITPSTDFVIFFIFSISLILLIIPLTVIIIPNKKMVYLLVVLQSIGFLWFGFFFDEAALLFIPWAINFSVIGYSFKKFELTSVFPSLD